jgi:hypothetical protein
VVHRGGDAAASERIAIASKRMWWRFETNNKG